MASVDKTVGEKNVSHVKDYFLKHVMQMEKNAATASILSLFPEVPK